MVLIAPPLSTVQEQVAVGSMPSDDKTEHVRGETAGAFRAVVAHEESPVETDNRPMHKLANGLGSVIHVEHGW